MFSFKQNLLYKIVYGLKLKYILVEKICKIFMKLGKRCNIKYAITRYLKKCFMFWCKISRPEAELLNIENV